MTPFLQLIILLAIIIFAAKYSGYLSTRLGQPSVFGQLLIGVILGPSLLNITGMPFITDPHVGDIIKELGELGVLILMFLAGLELHLGDLVKNSRVSAYGGILGVIFPVLMGLGVGELAGLDFSHAMFLGLTLGATSVSISAQTLMELKVLRSRVGLGLLGAAVFDDILVILLLSIYLALESGAGGVGQILLVFGKMILFLGLSVGVGIWLLPRLVRLNHRLRINMGVLTLSIMILLVYGVAAEVLGGMAAITGTFLAGLMFARTSEKKEIEEGLHSLAYAFFVPIFFVNIGLGVNIRSLDLNSLWLMLGISVVAILGKILGAGLGSRIAGFSWLESLQVGIGMVSRGEVGLIVAKVGLDQGLLDMEIFSAIVGMVLITTLLTPPMLRAAFKSIPTKPKQPKPTDSKPITDQEAV